MIGKDSCLQFYYNPSDTSLRIIDKFTTNNFYTKIKPCLFEFNDSYVFKYPTKYTYKTFVDKYHNKKIDFFFIRVNDSSKEKILIHQFFDKEAFRLATSYYSEVISRYFSTTPKNDNIISSGVWDGNLLRLINDDYQLFNMISWYLKIEACPITVLSFKEKKQLLFFNLNDSSILCYNRKFELINDTPILLSKTSKQPIKTIIQDKKTGIIYGVFVINGIYYISKINILDGKLTTIIKASPKIFPQIFKIYNNYCFSVYYNADIMISKIIKINVGN